MCVNIHVDEHHHNYNHSPHHHHYYHHHHPDHHHHHPLITPMIGEDHLATLCFARDLYHHHWSSTCFGPHTTPGSQSVSWLHLMRDKVLKLDWWNSKVTSVTDWLCVLSFHLWCGDSTSPTHTEAPEWLEVRPVGHAVHGSVCHFGYSYHMSRFRISVFTGFHKSHSLWKAVWASNPVV